MSNETDRRTEGRTPKQGPSWGRAVPRAAAAAAALLLAVWPSARLSAQVGHDPEHSPFADVTTKQTLTPFVSRFFGNTSHAGVGPQPGLAVGARFGNRLSGALELWVTLAYVSSQRNVVDPSLPVATRVTGPVDYRLVSADLSLAFNLTGAKTWHGLAPYVGAGFGIVSPTASTTDPSGFKAESHISFVPTIGTRMRLTRSTSLTLEVRDNLVHYTWPSQFFADANGNAVPPAVLPPVLDANTEKSTQTTHNFTLTAGLSYHFNF
jgi:hypothetical protein